MTARAQDLGGGGPAKAPRGGVARTPRGMRERGRSGMGVGSAPRKVATEG